MAELISQSELARRTGKAQPYIARLIKEGRLSFANEPKKLLDYQACLKILNQKAVGYDHLQEINAKQKGAPKAPPKPKPQTPRPKPQEQDDAEIPKNDDKTIPDDAASINKIYNKARAAEKMYMAKLKELEAKEKSGELLKADTVKKEAAEIGNLITQKLYNMVYKLSPLMVGIDDPKQAKAILESEVEAVLDELNRMSNEF